MRESIMCIAGAAIILAVVIWLAYSKGWRAVTYRSNNKSRQPGTNIKEKYYEWIR